MLVATQPGLFDQLSGADLLGLLLQPWPVSHRPSLTCNLF